MTDKDIERLRYDSRAKDLLKNDNYVITYEQPLHSGNYLKLLSEIPIGSRVLEIGAGMGENTVFLLDKELEVYATDISASSVEVMFKRFSHHLNFHSQIEDMEKLSFSDEYFDVVCSAGSLSYGDNFLVMEEIHRVLKSGGIYLALDSLNHNPIYIFNRFLHFKRGKRSKSTLERMPTVDLIEDYGERFGALDVNYFGSITWLFPLLKMFLGVENLLAFSDIIDKKFNIKKSAFKFTMKVTKS